MSLRAWFGRERQLLRLHLLLLAKTDESTGWRMRYLRAETERRRLDGNRKALVRRLREVRAENGQLRDVLAGWIIRAAELEYELQAAKGNPS